MGVDGYKMKVIIAQDEEKQAGANTTVQLHGQIGSYGHVRLWCLLSLYVKAGTDMRTKWMTL